MSLWWNTTTRFLRRSTLPRDDSAFAVHNPHQTRNDLRCRISSATTGAVMEYTKLGSSDLEVSRICLGTVFRSEMAEEACLAAIDAALDQGVNFLDCANVYRNGYSETIVGKAIRGRRDRFVVSTKVGSQVEGDAASGGLSRVAITKALEASLRRLRTDYVDFYLCHFPDPSVPTEETVRAMDDLVKQGKVRFPGCSNFESWRLYEALLVSERERISPFVCNQVGFSLLDRRVEEELVPFCQQRGVAVTAFAPMAIGLLSGRFRYGQPPPEGTSWHRGPYNYRAAMTPRVDAVIQTVIDVGDARHKTPSQVAMAWCLHQPGIDVVITGADTPERVFENCGAAGWSLSQEEVQQLDEVSDGQRLKIRKDCPDGYRRTGDGTSF